MARSANRVDAQLKAPRSESQRNKLVRDHTDVLSQGLTIPMGYEPTRAVGLNIPTLAVPLGRRPVTQRPRQRFVAVFAASLAG
jgi:hypothetical protein